MDISIILNCLNCYVYAHIVFWTVNIFEFEMQENVFLIFKDSGNCK